MAVTGDTVYAVIETYERGGEVRSLSVFRTEAEAVDDIVATAKSDGYIDEEYEITEAGLRAAIVGQGYYLDGDIRTTLMTAFLADATSKRRD